MIVEGIFACRFGTEYGWTDDNRVYVRLKVVTRSLPWIDSICSGCTGILLTSSVDVIAANLDVPMGKLFPPPPSPSVSICSI